MARAFSTAGCGCAARSRRVSRNVLIGSVAERGECRDAVFDLIVAAIFKIGVGDGGI